MVSSFNKIINQLKIVHLDNATIFFSHPKVGGILGKNNVRNAYRFCLFIHIFFWALSKLYSPFDIYTVFLFALTIVVYSRLELWIKKRDDPQFGLPFQTVDNKIPIIVSLKWFHVRTFMTGWVFVSTIAFTPLGFVSYGMTYMVLTLLSNAFSILFIWGVLFYLKFDNPHASYYSRVKDKIKSISFERPPQLIPVRVSTKSMPGGAVR